MIRKKPATIAAVAKTRLVRETDWNDIKVERSVQIGPAGEQICAPAETLGADLIVTSTHGFTGLKHVRLGSTAEHVVHHAAVAGPVVPNHPRPRLK